MEAWEEDNLVPHDPLLAHLRVHDHRILLIQFPRAGCVPTLSPFALKLETWLRVADLPYMNVSNNFRTVSKKGQIPYIELDGRQIADSNFIIRHLKKEFEKNNPDADLSDEERATSTAFMALVEDRLFWVLANTRARNNEWVASDEAFGGHFSGFKHRLFKNVFLRLYRCKIRKACYAQGVSRLTQLEIEAQAKADLSALSSLLGGKDYFFGDKPCTLDCGVFGLLCQFIYTPIWPVALKRHIEDECANLVAMIERMKESYWPDWEEATEKLDLHTEWKRARMIAERYSLAPCEVSTQNLTVEEPTLPEIKESPAEHLSS